MWSQGATWSAAKRYMIHTGRVMCVSSGDNTLAAGVSDGSIHVSGRSPDAVL